MHSFSSSTELTKYNNIMSGSYKVETRYYIDSVEYTKNNILSASINGSLYDSVTIGRAHVRTLEMSLRNIDSDDIATGAEIRVEQRVSNSSTSSEWIKRGTFYLAKRVIDGIRLNLTAYDKLYSADIPFFSSGTWVSTTALDVVKNMVCSDLGISLESSTESLLTNTPVTIPFVPAMGATSTTDREMLEYVATAYGGNWAINDDGELQLFLLNSLDTSNAIEVGLNCKSLNTAKAFPAIDRVVVSSGGAEYRYPAVSEATWEAMTGTILNASNPYASSELAQAIYTAVEGFVYQGYEASSSFVGPVVELGDTIHVGDIYAVIASQVINISNKSPNDLSAQIITEVEEADEYKYSTPQERTTARVEAQTQASIAVLQDQINLKVSTSTFEAAEATNYESITPMYLANDGTRTPSIDDPNWSTTPPTLQEGQHMWTMTVYVRKSGATSYSQPMDITGTEGVAGRGIERVENFYQVSSSGDTAPSTWPAAGVIPQMTPTNRFLWGYETTYYTDGTNESTTPHVIGVYGQTGQAGADAYNYELIVSNPVIVKSEAGAYNPTSIVLTAKRGQGTGSPANYSGRFKIESTTNNSTWTSVYTSSSNEATRTQSVPSNIIALRCSLYLAGGTTTLLDQQTVPIVSDGPTGPQGNAGADGYTVLLSNENHSFAAGTSAATATNITVNVLAYKGATQIAATIGTITGQVTGLTTSLVNNGTTSAGFKVTVTTSLTTKSGQLTIPVTVDGKSFTKIFSWSLALTGQTGAEGDDGVGIASITEYYGRSRVSTTEPTASGDAGSWSTTYQTVDSTWKFLWNYEVVTYTDSTSFTSQKRVIGTYAQDGTDGRNPIAFDQYLCANEDPDNPPAASANWIHVSLFNLADYQNDANHHYYIWTKTKTTWDVGEPTWTEPYLDTYYVNVTAQLDVLAGSIRSSVSEIYTAIGDETTAREELEGVVDEYGKRISTVESWDTTVTQTARGLEAITTWVYGEDGEHGANEYLTTQQSYLRWDGTESTLSVGVTGEAVHTEMRKNAFAVTQNDSDVMLADTNGVTAKSFIAAESVDIGRFRWVDEGSLGFSLI